VTDIPVGSPPVPPGRHAAPGGWYPDPTDNRRERYWDGWQWSRNTRDADNPTGTPAGPGPAAAPNGVQQQPQVGGASQPPYGQNPYPQQGQQNPYGQQGQQNPYPQQGQNPFPQQGQQNPYGQQGQNPYPQQQGQQNPYGQNPYGADPYGQNAYPQQGQNPYAPNTYAAPFPVNVPGQQAVATADGVRLAGWWIRVLAVLIDWLIVSLISVIPNFGIYARFSSRVATYFSETMRAAESGQPAAPLVPTDLMPTSDQITLTLVGLGVALAYNLAFVRLKRATPGKLVCGLRIVPVDQGHFSGPLPWPAVLIRVALWLLPKVQGYLLILKLADVLFPLWNPKRQALHDLAAKTQVIVQPKG